MAKRPAVLIPTAVLQRAKLAAKEHEPSQRARPAQAAPRALKATGAREKVIAALKRFHPMD